jgi:protein SCO1/2
VKRLIPLLALALLLSGCGSAKHVQLTGHIVDPPFRVAGTTLTDTDGTPYTLAKDPTATVTVLFFGYTHCPDLCPAIMSALSAGLAKLPAQVRDKIEVAFVTSDPKRDSPEVLRRYLDRFGKGYVGLTGPLDQVAALGRSVGIFVDKGDQLPGGGYDPNSHGTYVFAIDSTHTAPLFWNGDTSPSQFADDLRFLVTQATPGKLHSGKQ